jgi:SAM-dependent methyltransferase
MNTDPPRLYGPLAGWFHLLTAPEEYAEEAVFYTRLLKHATTPPASTLLELGCGGGNNAWHMKAAFTLTLTDVSPAMLDLSRSINPECEHVPGDMRTLRLGRTFDAVFVQDAASYLTSRRDLRQAVDTAWVHCRPGGAALFAPDFLRETFRPGTAQGGRDGDGRALRYLEWTWDPDPSDDTYLADMAYLLREADGGTRVEMDRHTLGMFPRAAWFEAMRGAGFQPACVPFEVSSIEPGSAEVLLGVRPIERAGA